MHFSEVVQSIARRAGVAEAQAVIRALHGRGASRWLADAAGISRRTARRWLSTGYPRGRAAQILDTARDLGAAALAAQVLPQVSTIDVGSRVPVFYKPTRRGEGTRDIHAVTPGRDYLDQCAADLLAGAADAAEEAFSDAVISGYEDGLEETLGIEEYPSGVTIQ